MRPRERLLNLLFPPKCPFCARVLDGPGICPACEAALPWTTDKEGLREGPGGLRCAAPLRYEGLVREGLARFKFQGGDAAAEPLGELIARTAAERYSGEFDAVTWAPVSRRRLRQRGYDQSERLARAACRLWGTAPERLLNKVRDNPPQSGIGDAEARRANVLGVYETTGEIAGRRVLLIDDICTTGATLAECAGMLRAAGAAEVMCAVVALAARENVYNSKPE